MSGDNAQSRASAPPRLEWQSELDSVMTDIDDRLTHPRRRASDVGRQPVLPDLAQVDLTSELLDEIAWRVAEQLRRHQAAVAAGSVPGPDASPAGPGPQGAPPVATAPPPPVLQPGKMLLIRYRVPSLPWPFRLLRRRRRQHPLTVRASS
jgi:hypothetical protein